YVSRRRMMHMPEPTIYLPQSAVADVEQLLNVMQRLDRGRMPCKLVGCKPGDEFSLSREHVLTAVAAYHTIPTLGWIVWDRRRKLKPEYHGLSESEIRDLRLGGAEVSQEIRTPLAAYVGDTNSNAFDRCPTLYQTKILLMEVTFLAPGHRRDMIHKFGHIHFDDVVERADLFENELIVAGHVSTRYHDDQVRRMVEKRLPARLRDRFLLWL
ncbi:MAG: MBL fold metallo-hydrolase, partial [Planctomycetia bacterium]